MCNQSKAENNFSELSSGMRSVHVKLDQKSLIDIQKKQIGGRFPSYIYQRDDVIDIGFKPNDTNDHFSSIIGESGQMDHARRLAQRFAVSSANILLMGESGTGKELFAQAIHDQSRPSGPFISLNCAAIPKGLIESELFGYDGGAFTGAKKNGNQGKVELAAGGSLFLDEIGDMPLETQAVLLRVLETKQVMRVGGRRYLPVDFRLIAATNKDLQRMANDGLFRLDLYYRLSVLTLSIPPLCQRGKDIIVLAKFFLKKHCGDAGKMPELGIDTQLKLMECAWPGNVRQLENAMIYALHVLDDDTILPEHLPDEITKKNIGGYAEASQPFHKVNRQNTIESMKEAEDYAIKNALSRTNNNIALAASLLGVSKSTLYRKAKMIGIHKSGQTIL